MLYSSIQISLNEPLSMNSQFLHTSSNVIDWYSNFGNIYLSKEFPRVLGPGQIVTSLEHLAQCQGGSSLNTWHSAEVFKWRHYVVWA